MTEINDKELQDLRFQASQYIPWYQEAHRLADALHAADPSHPLLKGEMWQEYIAEKVKRAADGAATEPAFKDGEPVDA